jgi:hypothetical protein
MSAILQVEGVTGASIKTNQQLASEEEQAKLEQLRACTMECAAKLGGSSPEATSDLKLLRFLRGYSGSVKDAALAYADMVEWRLENDVADVVATLKKVEADEGQLTFPYEMPMFQPLIEALGTKDGLMRFNNSTDRAGNLLTSVAVGLYDLRKVVRANLSDLLIKSNIYVDCYFEILLERLSLQNLRLMQRHDLLIVSNPSIGLFQFSPSALRLIKRISMNSKHFPETIAKITSCGNNMMAVGIWKIIRPFVPKHTTEKITVLGSSFQEELLKSIEGSAIEAFGRYN